MSSGLTAPSRLLGSLARISVIPLRSPIVRASTSWSSISTPSVGRSLLTNLYAGMGSPLGHRQQDGTPRQDLRADEQGTLVDVELRRVEGVPRRLGRGDAQPQQAARDVRQVAREVLAPHARQQDRVQ